ncbi:MAG: hypothetical protein LBB53_02390 [Prevotellaceae bacterium]|nr:hypothetical protein [Prevotellaceae bacterium]
MNRATGSKEPIASISVDITSATFIKLGLSLAIPLIIYVGLLVASKKYR